VPADREAGVTPERAANWALRWVRLYTRGLRADVAERRREELAADLDAHLAQRGTAREIVSRTLRGLAADLAWRGSQPKEGRSMRTPLHRSAARVALGVALILALPLVAMQFRDDVVWSLGDFVVAGVLLAVIGTVVELAVRAAGNLLLAAGIAILGILAVFAGGSDDAPGMVLLGLLLIASAVALGVRRVGRGPSARRQR
jgi:hypothetical protein